MKWWLHSLLSFRTDVCLFWMLFEFSSDVFSKSISSYKTIQYSGYNIIQYAGYFHTNQCVQSVRIKNKIFSTMVKLVMASVSVTKLWIHNWILAQAKAALYGRPTVSYAAVLSSLQNSWELGIWVTGVARIRLNSRSEFFRDSNIYFHHSNEAGRSLCGIMANMLDDIIVVSKFKL